MAEKAAKSGNKSSGNKRTTTDYGPYIRPIPAPVLPTKKGGGKKMSGKGGYC